MVAVPSQPEFYRETEEPASDFRISGSVNDELALIAEERIRARLWHPSSSILSDWELEERPTVGA